MSHLKERKEKTCLNCGTTPLNGRYCHVCGQENLEPKETVWYLVRHFFEDVTHFDGKFFSTVRYLLKKPGFLSREYMIGRRASYLNPIRMYVFTSAIFFVLLFALRSSMKVAKITFAKDKKESKKDPDSASRKELDTLDLLVKNNSGWHPENFNTVRIYDSTQKILPDGKQDGWFKRSLMRRLVAANEEYRRDNRSFNEHLTENYLHSFPKVLFFSLPFFALVLRLLYVRRKQYLYVDHGIFTIHIYCATFLLLLVNILLGELSNHTSLHWLQSVCGWLELAVMLYLFIYLYRAMLFFYGQGWFKTLVKYVLLGILALMVNGFLLLLFLLISAITIA